MNLAANTVAFALAFAAWIALGPAARVIGGDLGLSSESIAWLKALPILSGAILRFPAGVLVQRLGAQRTFPLLLTAGALACVGLSMSTSAAAVLSWAAALGVVGSTFVVGVHSVSTVSPPSRQGLALGVFGAANIGSALTTALLPLALDSVRWQTAIRGYAIVLLFTAAAYGALVRDRSAPSTPSFAEVCAPLADLAAWRFGLYYMATFGAFVAVALIATDLYIDEHHLSLPLAGVMATTFTFSSSLARVPGGWLADRLGGARVLQGSLVVLAAALLPLAFLHSLILTAVLIFAAGIAMGVGMAATYQCIPTRFPTAVGATAGVVGALGGLAGFLLPLVGGVAQTHLGSTRAQLGPICLLVIVALLVHLRAGDRERSI